MIRRLIDLLLALALDIKQCHTDLDGEWVLLDPADSRAKAEHDEAIQLAGGLMSLLDMGFPDGEFLDWAAYAARMRTIEAAANHAIKLAQAGEAMGAYDALVAALGDH